jgi:hypothetical protein
MIGFYSALNRKDLFSRYSEYKEKKKSEQQSPITNMTVKDKTSNSNLESSTSKGKKNTAFDKFINKEKESEEIDEFSDDEFDELSSNSDFKKEEKEDEEILSRIVLNVNLNILNIELFDHQKEEKSCNIFLIEISGFQFSLIRPECNHYS